MATKKTNNKIETTNKVVAKKEEACKCEKCNCANNECLLKSIFYTLICIFVCAFISTIFIIILTINYYNNNKDNGNNTYEISDNSGNNDKTGSGNGQTADYDISRFTEINADQVVELFNGEEKSFIYIGRPTCGYCVKFLPSINKAIDELNFKAYYYNTDNLDEETYYKLAGLNDWMGENFGSTPMVIVVQGGKIVSAEDNGEGWVGYSEYESFKSYLQGLGY